MFNPYEFMLEIRNNRVLFQYLEVAAVYYSDDKGWTIQGQSRDGKTEIYQLSGEVIRVSLPIPVPEFITVDILHKILDGLNTSIEGLATVVEEEGLLFIEYHLHASLYSQSSLDEALLKFVQERAEINEGFDSLEQDYRKMQGMMSQIMDNIPKAPPISKPPTSSGGSENLSSLWNDMDDIDKKLDEEGDDDLNDTLPDA